MVSEGTMGDQDRKPKDPRQAGAKEPKRRKGRREKEAGEDERKVEGLAVEGEIAKGR
jgi:hypothetical protein